MKKTIPDHKLLNGLLNCPLSFVKDDGRFSIEETYEELNCVECNKDADFYKCWKLFWKKVKSKKITDFDRKIIEDLNYGDKNKKCI